MLEPNIQSINILDLAKPTQNIYKSVAIIGKRANQIAAEIKSELSDRLSEFSSPQDTLEETFENREQIEIARHYEQLPKPSIQALNEFLKGKVRFYDPHAD